MTGYLFHREQILHRSESFRLRWQPGVLHSLVNDGVGEAESQSREVMATTKQRTGQSPIPRLNRDQ